MVIAFTSQELAQKYDRFARWYDLAEGLPELLGVKKLRRRMFRGASGSVLEVAVGTGKNLAYQPRGCRIIAVDRSKEMLNVARKRAGRLALQVSFLVADAEALPFRQLSFDTAVSSLSTCTFPNPIAALREMARVCRSDGKILLLEHGRSDRKSFARWQDRYVDKFARSLGCHWNREPLVMTGDAGLKVVRSRRRFFGIFHQIEAQPGPR